MSAIKDLKSIWRLMLQTVGKELEPGIETCPLNRKTKNTGLWHLHSNKIAVRDDELESIFNCFLSEFLLEIVNRTHSVSRWHTRCAYNLCTYSLQNQSNSEYTKEERYRICLLYCIDGVVIPALMHSDLFRSIELPRI